MGLPSCEARTFLSFFLLGGALCTFLLGACRTATSVELERTQWEDVPVPEAFLPMSVGGQSYRYRDAELNVGTFHYSGISRPEAVASFYENTMPAYGWMRTVAGSDPSPAAAVRRTIAKAAPAVQHWAQPRGGRLKITISQSDEGDTHIAIVRSGRSSDREVSR